MDDDFKVADEFEKDFPTPEANDPFNEGIKPEKEEEDVATIKDRDNREARRAKRKLQEEREANIAMAERLKVLSEQVSELSKFKSETKEELDGDLHKVLFGNAVETPETRATALNLQKVLEKNAEIAKESALREFEARSEVGNEAYRAEKDFVDAQFEALEDEFSIDLTSKSQTRDDFIDFVEKLSRKDGEGNIVEYPDFRNTYEIFQTLQKRDTTRQKSIGSRGMVRSGNTTETLADKTTQDYLKSIGVL